MTITETTFGKSSQAQRMKSSTIRFTRNGKISLSSGAVERIKIDTKNQLALIKRLKAVGSNEEWFLCIVDASNFEYKEGVKLHSVSVGNGLTLCHKQAANSFLDALESGKGGITCQIATVATKEKPGIKYYAIITAPRVAKLKENNIRQVPTVRFVVGQRVAEVVPDQDDA